MNARNAASRVLSTLFYIVAFFCALSPFVFLKTAPPYLDFDSATEGIFVNNLTFRNSFDFYFKDSPAPQDQYRRGYAAYRLPLSLPLSVVQQIFHIPAHSVDLLLKVVGGLGFLIGALFAALLVRASALRRESIIFIVAGTLAYPPILLASRSGIMFWGVLFAFYWAALYFTIRGIQEQRPSFLYVAALPGALLIVNLWTNLPTLPLALLIFFLCTGNLRHVLRAPRTYAALAVCTCFVVFIYIGVCAYLKTDFGSYWALASNYPFERRDKISIARLIEEPAKPKLVKLVNQQLLFNRDTFGDPYRPDDLWTLGTWHPAWLLLFGAMVFGCIIALRRRDREMLPYFSVAGATVLFFLTLSFPEGRYMLIVAPCYLAFIDYTFRRVSRSPLVETSLRLIALALLGGTTFFLVATNYNGEMRTRWANRDGLREIAEALSKQNVSDSSVIQLPQQRYYGDWLYFAMLTNFAPRWLDETPGTPADYTVTTTMREDSSPLATVRSPETDQQYFIWKNQ